MEKSRNKKPVDVKFVIIALIGILVIAAVVAAIIVGKGKSKALSSSAQEIEEKLDISIKEPEAAESIAYDIENNTIARVSYSKAVEGGGVMHFVMRSSSSEEEDLASFSHNVNFGEQPIYMTVGCEDQSEVEVEAYVALDNEGNMKYMKALWMDNDKYYSMITEDLITREDFLQEVNRVIIANHIPF